MPWTRLEALMLKVKQLEEECDVYAQRYCPMCHGKCVFGGSYIRCLAECKKFVDEETGHRFKFIPTSYEDFWLYEYERRFWISHCLREIKAEILTNGGKI